MKLVLTSAACPEQYTLRDDHGTEIGFFRLRHGWFRAEDGYGQILHDTRELASDGVFEGDEREQHMVPAIDLMLAAQGIRQPGLATALLKSTRSALESQLDDWDDLDEGQPFEDEPALDPLRREPHDSGGIDFDDGHQEGIR